MQSVLLLAAKQAAGLGDPDAQMVGASQLRPGKVVGYEIRTYYVVVAEYHPGVASQALNSLSAAYKSQGRYADAERLCKRALAIQEENLGCDRCCLRCHDPLLLCSAEGLEAFPHARLEDLRSLNSQPHRLGSDVDRATRTEATVLSFNNCAGAARRLRCFQAREASAAAGEGIQLNPHTLHHAHE